MSYQGFRYCILHAARDAGAAAITGNNAFHADYPKDFLIDDRAGSLCKFNTSESDHYYQFDRGASGLEALIRLIIPSGHNLDGNTITLQADDDVAFGSPTALLTTSAVAAGLIDKTFASNTERYLRLLVNGTGAWEVGQIHLTRTRSMVACGPERGWPDFKRHNTQDFPLESGVVASLSRGADRQVYELLYLDVEDSDDLAIFADLIATCGTSKPFYLDPMFDTESVIWMKLSADSEQQQNPLVPASTDAPQKRIPLAMLEHLA